MPDWETSLEWTRNAAWLLSAFFFGMAVATRREGKVWSALTDRILDSYEKTLDSLRNCQWIRVEEVSVEDEESEEDDDAYRFN